MIQENNFKQIEHLIFEMSKPFTQEEQIQLAEVCCRMSKNEIFEKQYTDYIKAMYVHNYKAIKNCTYQKKSFSNINKQTLYAIENRKYARPAIDPSFNKTSINNTLARIKSIKDVNFNK